MIRAIVFDLDGTLVNTVRYSLKAFRAMLAEQGIKARPREILSLYGEPVTEIFRHFVERQGKRLSVEKLAREHEALQLSLIVRKNLFLPGAEKLLKALKKKGFLVGLVTGSSRNIARAELLPKQEKLFDVIVTASDVKRGKPFPDQLEKAMKKLGVSPGEVLYVGDAVMDVLAAGNARVKAIAVATKHSSSSKRALLEEKPLAVLSSLKQLPGFLKKLEKKSGKG